MKFLIIKIMQKKLLFMKIYFINLTLNLIKSLYVVKNKSVNNSKGKVKNEFRKKFKKKYNLTIIYVFNNNNLGRLCPINKCRK